MRNVNGPAFPERSECQRVHRMHGSCGANVGPGKCLVGLATGLGCGVMSACGVLAPSPQTDVTRMPTAAVSASPVGGVAAAPQRLGEAMLTMRGAFSDTAKGLSVCGRFPALGASGLSGSAYRLLIQGVGQSATHLNDGQLVSVAVSATTAQRQRTGMGLGLETTTLRSSASAHGDMFLLDAMVQLDLGPISGQLEHIAGSWSCS